MKIRAKLRLDKVEQFETCEVLAFSAVGASNYPVDGVHEDNTYCKFTPSAELRMTVTNPALLGKFKPGERYYVDFTLAE